MFRWTIDDVAHWSKTVIEDYPLETTAEVVGSTFISVTESEGKRMDFRGEVIRHDPPKLSEMKLIGDAFDIDVIYTFKDLGGVQTEVSQRSRVHAKGFLRVVFVLISWALKPVSRNALNRELQSLKQYCEKQQQV
ncbi:MAG: hypothetical protein AB8B91_09935 [Rubripirellula sp.]